MAKFRLRDLLLVINKTANTHNPYSGKEEINHRKPKEILREIEGGEKKLELVLGEIKKLI